MKTLSILLVLIVMFPVFSQDAGDLQSEKDTIVKYIDSTLVKPSYVLANGTRKDLLLNPQTLNAFFNKNVSSYLTGEEDISLFNTYAIANSADGRLFIGKNFTTKTKNDFIRSMLTTGFHLDIDDGFSKVIEDASFQNNTGISFQFTAFSRGLVNYYERGRVNTQVAKRVSGAPLPDQRTLMQVKRLGIAEEIELEIEKSFNDFEQKYDSLESKIEKLKAGPKEDPVLIAALEKELSQLKEDFLKSQLPVAKNSFYEKELAEFETRKYFHYSKEFWYSLYVYVPVTVSEYTVAVDFDSEIGTKSYYPWEIRASANGLINDRSRTWFGYLSYKLENTNSVKRSTISSVNIAEYRPLGGTDTLKLANLSSDDIYIGDYENFAQSSISAQIGVMFKEMEKLKARMGVSFVVEQIAASDYSPTNVQLGFPISLAGRKKDAPVNIQPTLQLPDVRNSETDDDVKDKLIVGISLALPFGNTIYE